MRIAVEPCHQRSCCSEPDGEKKADAQVDPEQVAGQEMIDLFPLNDGLCKPVQPEVRKKQAEGGNHGHHPEVRGLK